MEIHEMLKIDGWESEFCATAWDGEKTIPIVVKIISNLRKTFSNVI